MEGRERREAEWMLALASLAIAAGGLLLGLQVDGNGALAGTGYAALAIGGLVALVATLLQVTSSGRLPRDPAAAAAAAAAFLGLAFVVSGVLAPGGPWMFCEVFVLLWLLARRRSRTQAGGPEVSGGSLMLLGLMLLFRLWITWQGSQHRWQVASVDIPVLSWIPLRWLEPVQAVELGSFTPDELGFPPTGIDFALTASLWAAGFCLCAAGLWLRGRAAAEHEDDRIHDLIQTLPPGPARLVERLLPEAEWAALGLHGLPERALGKRIEALVGERILRHGQIRAALEADPPGRLRAAGGFAGEIVQALGGAGPGAHDRGERAGDSGVE
jgi:hypothetical protein